MLFRKCIEYTNTKDRQDQQSVSAITTVYRAMENLCVLFSFLFGSNTYKTEESILLVISDNSMNSANDLMFQLAHNLFLSFKLSNREVTEMSLRLLLIILTGRDNLNQNSLVTFFMEGVTELIGTDTDIHSISFSALVSIMLLANYQRMEMKNAVYDEVFGEQRLSAFYDKVTSVFQHCLQNSVSSTSVADQTTTVSNQSAVVNVISWIYDSALSVVSSSASSPTTSSQDSTTKPYMCILLLVHELLQFSPPAQSFLAHLMSNNDWMSYFVLYTSQLFQKSNDLRSLGYEKLCLNIMNILLDSPEIYTKTLTVEMKQTRKQVVQLSTAGNASVKEEHLIVCYFLDLVILFLSSNLRKKFQSDSYRICMCIIQKIILHIKQHRLRLKYKWLCLYSSLVSVVKYIVSHSNVIMKDRPISVLVLESIVSVFNYVISHGDTFLPDTTSYDMAYYEIILNAEYFTKMEELILKRRQTIDQQEKRLFTRNQPCSFVNIKTIISHFIPKIQESSVVTPDMVVKLLREYYDTLELKVTKIKIADSGFEVYDRLYYRQMLKIVVCDARNVCCGYTDYFKVELISNGHNSAGEGDLERRPSSQ